MTSRDKRYAEWLASHVNKWGHPPSPGEAWAEAERQALERAAQRAEAKSMDCHTLGNAEEFRELAACIRALIGEQSKEGS